MLWYRCERMTNETFVFTWLSNSNVQHVVTWQIHCCYNDKWYYQQSTPLILTVNKHTARMYACTSFKINWIFCFAAACFVRFDMCQRVIPDKIWMKYQIIIRSAQQTAHTQGEFVIVECTSKFERMWHVSFWRSVSTSCLKKEYENFIYTSHLQFFFDIELFIHSTKVPTHNLWKNVYNNMHSMYHVSCTENKQ